MFDLRRCGGRAAAAPKSAALMLGPDTTAARLRDEPPPSCCICCWPGPLARLRVDPPVMMRMGAEQDRRRHYCTPVPAILSLKPFQNVD